MIGKFGGALQHTIKSVRGIPLPDLMAAVRGRGRRQSGAFYGVCHSCAAERALRGCGVSAHVCMKQTLDLVCA